MGNSHAAARSVLYKPHYIFIIDKYKYIYIRSYHTLFIRDINIRGYTSLTY